MKGRLKGEDNKGLTGAVPDIQILESKGKQT